MSYNENITKLLHATNEIKYFMEMQEYQLRIDKKSVGCYVIW